MARLEHFAIYAADPTALKDSYIQAMGLRVALEAGGDPPAYFLADDHGMALEIIGRPPGQSNASQRWICHLAFWVDDVLAKRIELERRGIVFEAETAVDNDSMKTAFFHDPEGNRCQIVWRSRRLEA
ncbi:MAG: VOC family protein [Isosphaeraceae bacterium]